MGPACCSSVSQESSPGAQSTHVTGQAMDQDSQGCAVSKVWEGVWAGEGSATPRSDSGLNSMEYWDYSVELECITGQQGDG